MASGTGNPHFSRLHNVKTVEDCKEAYDGWAETYDAELTDPSQDYVGPEMVAQAVLSAGGKIDGLILDAGCGTGLSGKALSQAGAKTIDGVDLSPGMLKVAEKTGVYRVLATQDLSQPMKQDDETYDVVTCVGTLTQAHLGPVPALKEFVRVTKKGGLVVATVLRSVWESDGYKAEVERLEQEGLVQVVSTESTAYRRGQGVNATMLVMRKR